MTEKQRDGLVCHNENCGHFETDVKDTRPTMSMIRRRRQCPKCGSRFTTYEIPLAVLNQVQAQLRQSAAIKSALESALQSEFHTDIFKMEAENAE